MKFELFVKVVVGSIRWYLFRWRYVSSKTTRIIIKKAILFDFRSVYGILGCLSSSLSACAL